ncbi:DNA alkylation repair protein [Vibrio maerlii]|uniref:DNA alkylation repair protein n=1 Tax=Vibrio maerlii TaxID=2231648 RepID=UPI000E3E8868|nr:DNA alkylation repair protein [Vibrio maerlii]
MHPWNVSITQTLRPLANIENAISMRAYMRNQFEFLGIQSTPRREALKPYFINQQLPHIEDIDTVVRELWEQPEREYQLVAVDLLIKLKKKLPASFLSSLEYLITTKSWWDTIDFLSSHIAGQLYIEHPKSTAAALRRWRQSDNIWLRRTAILFQLKYKQSTDHKLLYTIIGENLYNNEFFIQKAIGWSLREYSKTNPKSVIEFIETKNIQGLARREGLKWLNNQANK